MTIQRRLNTQEAGLSRKNTHLEQNLVESECVGSTAAFYLQQLIRMKHLIHIL